MIAPFLAASAAFLIPDSVQLMICKVHDERWQMLINIFQTNSEPTKMSKDDSEDDFEEDFEEDIEEDFEEDWDEE